MNIWIRADGNEEIASGHLRRTLTIAEALRREGEEALFLLANEESRDVFLQLTDGNRSRWRYLLLGCTYADLKGELKRTEELMRAGVPDVLLVDSYAATPEYYERLKETASSCRIACLDDLMAFDPPVDLVINYAPDIAAAEAFYHHASVRLLGPEYAPLRTQFSGLEPEVRESVSRILITTGGSDPFGMADAAAEAVRRALPEAEDADSRTLPSGAAERHRRTLPDVQETDSRARRPVELVFAGPGHPYVSNMAALLSKCDLAVSAGGTTLYELCAAGVPTIAFSMADNQRIFARKMAAAGACTYAGDVQDAKERRRVLQKITQWVRRRCGDTGNSDNNGSVDAGLMLRRRESARMHVITDGCGADRIAGQLRKLL